MIGRDQIRRLLRESQIYSGIGNDPDDRAPIFLDSMALVWFLHALEEECGITIFSDAVTEDLVELTSIEAIHDYLNKHATVAGLGQAP